MKHIFSLTILCTILFIPFSVQAADSSDLCRIARRLSINPLILRADHTTSLFQELGKTCGFVWPPQQEQPRDSSPSAFTERPSAPFPITYPSFSPPRIPFCPNKTRPLDVVCGNAVPVSCTWQCRQGDGSLIRHP